MPNIFSARSSSPAPLAMENSGVPPVPKRQVNAATNVVRGKASPMPVRAILSAPGRWPI